MPGFLDDAADNGLLGGLVGFGGGFMKGMQDAEDRKYKRMEFEAKMKANETELAKNDFNKRLEARKAGFQVPEGNFDPGQLKWDPEWVQMQTGLRQAGAGADPYGNKALAAESARQGLLKSRTEQEEKLRKRNTSPIQGYQKGDDYVADPVEERGLRAGGAQIDKFNKILNSLKSRVQSADKKQLANPYSNAAKAIKNDLRDLQLLYKSKEFAELGVLAGPDLMLLEQVIEDPGTLSNLYSGKSGVLDRYNQLQQKVSGGWGDKVKSYGLIPVGGGAPPADLEAKKRRLEELRMKAGQ